jgi:hypothetical protein
MRILGIDPGPKQSAFVNWDSEAQKIISKGISLNDDLAVSLRHALDYQVDRLCVEMIASMGMPVGKEVFETVLFIGQVKEIWSRLYPLNAVHLIYRREIKIHFCQSMRAKDGNIRQALIDRLGVPGVKKSPGKLYRVKADEWQALALCIFFQEAIGK